MIRRCLGAAALPTRTGIASVESIHPPEVFMPTQEETEALVERLEDVLRRLAYGNYDPSGSCCSCLQVIVVMQTA